MTLFSFILMTLIEQALAQGLTPAIVVVIYLVIIRIIDAKKEAQQSKISQELINSISTISEFLDAITKNILNKDKERSRIIIELAFDNLHKELLIFARDIIITNNIDKRKEYINQSIKTVVNAQYYEVYNCLSVCEVNGHKAALYCKESWKEELSSNIIKIIFDENLDKVAKITEIQTKLKTICANYVTYIHNKTFNS